jgi:hypothetical protein
VPLTDFTRVKAHIVIDCPEIIRSLKAEFIVPISITEIHVLKNEAQTNLKELVEKLSVQIVVVKPRKEVAAAALA